MDLRWTAPTASHLGCGPPGTIFDILRFWVVECSRHGSDRGCVRVPEPLHFVVWSGGVSPRRDDYSTTVTLDPHRRVWVGYLERPAGLLHYFRALAFIEGLGLTPKGNRLYFCMRGSSPSASPIGGFPERRLCRRRLPLSMRPQRPQRCFRVR
jgi:hypothetical protein